MLCVSRGLRRSFTGVKTGMPRYPTSIKITADDPGGRAQRVLNQIKSWTSTNQPDVILCI